MATEEIIEQVRVKPHSKIRLRDFDPAWAGSKEMRKLSDDELKLEAKAHIQRNLKRLADSQELLYATNKYALLVILQGMDASGKDGTIKHVMSGLNPQGCQVFSFKQPTDEELAHDFLWRYHKRLPARGRIGIFNRSYYEEVLVVRVHPEWLERQKITPPKHWATFWEERYEDINAFEKHLLRSGTVIIKLFLHISKEEQSRRLLERLEDPNKHWKFSAADVAERAYWPEYTEAYEDALNATSSKRAPWYIIPADHKWVARSMVSEVLTHTIRKLDLKLPQLTKEEQAELAKAKRRLREEK
jgi:PPK2 family polyphosphate:nucleotide phosphotransferase